MPSNPPHQAGTAGSSAGKRSSPQHGAPVDGDFPVIGIGASAGGLEAYTALVASLPNVTGMAFILVQHLDPTHESMLPELLQGHTAMAVQQATEGTFLQPEHIYIIPPGRYLSVAQGALHLTAPPTRDGTRSPIDFLFCSLAESYRTRAVGVILSGSGADGSIGLKAIKNKGGLVIVQDPVEADYDGMPRSAIMTGVVDLVLPISSIPGALIKRGKRGERPVSDDQVPPPAVTHQECLPEIIELMRAKTARDFRLYKTGTLQRRIERRMSLAAIDKMDRYLEILQSDQNELNLLAADLLINVTAFFRDRKVFDLLAEQVIPDLIRSKAADGSVRIWIAGCSSGEETYSLAMLFREAITAAKQTIKLQIFASDVDPDAVAAAREGLYPESITAEVSPARLDRFFSREDHGYRVAPELRSSVVFTVQDVLVDPPFSRLDLISCRNLLIYLLPEAQAKVISVFHFALRDGGFLLLGGSETIGKVDGRFESISKSDRLFRHVGRRKPGDLGFLLGEGTKFHPRPLGNSVSRQATLADLCQRLVVEKFAPAAIIINLKHECLYSLGATDRYLRMATGLPTHDLLSMVSQDLRAKLRLGIQRASRESETVTVSGGGVKHEGVMLSFIVEITPTLFEGENLLLMCFVDAPKSNRKRIRAGLPQNLLQVAELQRELEETKKELQSALHNLEISGEEQTAINEEALSVNEEFQSTNEELLTSKEELQSLNEELTALNSQLQETLEQQKSTSNDLQNVLFSTDVATLFLDKKLNIRFFTPATKSLFSVIPGDLGRPLSDLRSLAGDSTLPTDAVAVMQSAVPIEREVEAQNDVWFVRRILPYRTHENGIEGVVITFTDITERKHISKALDLAKRQAELASLAKSRFLAAASHDLRQPLQTLVLLQGLLAKSVASDKGRRLLAQFDQTLSFMSGMLNTLLDINQIEAGTIHADKISFPIKLILDRLRDEFSYHAQARGLKLRVVLCSRWVFSDPRLLEQMIRNLLSNALKYTHQGTVLLGCRRHQGRLRIEIWDTGIGIPEGELEAIFEEYHQIDNVARENTRGLGLGLSIVQRLGGLLDHRVRVRSRLGAGSVFAIDVELVNNGSGIPPDHLLADANKEATKIHPLTGLILIVEDDPAVRTLLETILKDDGHRTVTAVDGTAALEWVSRKMTRPDLILVDYNLPNGLNGLQLSVELRAQFHKQIPVVILTGDISTDTLRAIASGHCEPLNKPVKLQELTEVIQRMLALPGTTPTRQQPQEEDESPLKSAASTLFVVDDDQKIREAIRRILEDAGHTVEDYANCEDFLKAYRPGRQACLLIDADLPGMNGLELLQQLHASGDRLPAIMITGNGDVPMAVQAMKAGASDFIEKPISYEKVIESIDRALVQSRDSNTLFAWHEAAADHIASLTARQRQIMALVLAGQASKNIAADLGISQRTVENHRASIMKKTGSKSLPALARLALAAAGND